MQFYYWKYSLTHGFSSEHQSIGETRQISMKLLQGIFYRRGLYLYKRDVLSLLVITIATKTLQVS